MRHLQLWLEDVVALTPSSITEHVVKPLIAAVGSVFFKDEAAFPFDRVLSGMVRVGLGIEAICTFLNLTRVVLDHHLVRLGLATPHDRPLRKPGRRGWSIHDTRRLIAWRVSGVHPEVIGQALERPRSANAVRAKARRLGLSAPPRRSLFKPNLTDLHDPAPDFAFSAFSEDAAESQCGRVADHEGFEGGTEGIGASESTKALSSTIVLPSGTPVAPAKAVRHGDLLRPEGQRDLPLFGIVDRNVPNNMPEVERIPARLLAAIPSSVEEVDLNGDLSWFSRVEHPILSEVAAWVAGVLTMGGLNRFAAARRLGVTEGAFRTFRTKVAVPVDFDRHKFGWRFSERGARATLEASGYVTRKCIISGGWFWVRRSDRGVHCSPCIRKRERSEERYVNRIEIITGAMLNARRRIMSAPFAARRAMVRV